MKTKQLVSALLALALALSLAACGSTASSTAASSAAASSEAASSEAASSAETTEEPVAVAIDKDAFDALITAGPVATDEAIAASEWATAVKEAGVLRVGGTRTSFLFSQLDETDNGVRGFDAGLYQLLARYILGDETKFELTQVTSSTR
ncbi:MAG: hypothetical protein ACI4OI_08240, partial [Gemmiger sp.]